MHNSSMARFHDTATRRRLLSVDLDAYQAIKGGHWLRGDVFLLPVRLEDPVDASAASDLREYVVVDLGAQQVTSTVGMTPAGRTALFAPLQPGAVAPRRHGDAPLPSPDGHLVMQGRGITTPDGTLVSPVPNGKTLGSCEHGWRPDSAGVYYLVGYRVGNWIGYTEYGPVRLLLVDPAHPPRP